MGDEVQSRNTLTRRTEAEKVTRIYKHLARQVLTITLHGSTNRTEDIDCTPGHPFYVINRGFIFAGRLYGGAQIATRLGPALTVDGVALHTNANGSSKAQDVYNLTVADDHTYFVGKMNGGAWVHNASENINFVSRSSAFRYAKGIAGVPLSQAPVDQYTIGPDQSRRSFANYRYSADPTTWGRAWVYDTPQGPRIVSEHLSDGVPHFHAGMPKDMTSFTDFRSQRYLQIGGHHHIYYTTP